MTNRYFPQQGPEHANHVPAGFRDGSAGRLFRPLASLAGVAALTAVVAVTTPAQQGTNAGSSLSAPAGEQQRTSHGSGQFELVVLDDGKPFDGPYATIWDRDTTAPSYYSGISDSGNAPVPSGPHSLTIGEADALPGHPFDIRFTAPTETIPFNVRAGKLTILYVDLDPLARLGLAWPSDGSGVVYAPETDLLG